MDYVRINMKRILLDTNSYGELAIDTYIDEIMRDVKMKECVIYGVKTIRKELRATPKNKLHENRKLRILMLNIYDQFVKSHELEETGEEIDFPAWWQSKITTAKNMMSGAKHYLDFELKEPYIDAAVDRATGEAPHMGEPEVPMMESEIGEDETLAGKIVKALKDMANKDASDQTNLKQARTANNDGNIKAAKKIAEPYLSEKILKQLKSK